MARRISRRAQEARERGQEAQRERAASGDEKPDRSKIPTAFHGTAQAVLTGLLGATGLVTFVAAVGGAIIWVRFYAAELPADQALAAIPQGELVASGAVMLALFLILGLAAAVGVYLFDSNTLGRTDGHVARDEALAHCRAIVAATDLPVSADLEKGFGDEPESAAETIMSNSRTKARLRPIIRLFVSSTFSDRLSAAQK